MAMVGVMTVMTWVVFFALGRCNPLREITLGTVGIRDLEHCSHSKSMATNNRPKRAMANLRYPIQQELI